ncbi:hypothetical protein [Helicobacter bilis]|uniref:Uncharacterized protein n=2 Tax=Helicobacter bilis TaxID=37372 RepID=A0A6D2CI96_9HELI|nr:hypothetical protein [Helicobacter bilis]EMZ39080.1 hypothetical protein C826_01056 [Helicobacter bilis WiWa]TLE06530.1 hypothetical protein LS77_000315 [Helicobacter bilis]TLE07000.1 hypothetical protein LS76_000575 [Helicobacter bilis]
MKEKTKQEIIRNHVAKIDKHEDMGLSSEARKIMELFLKETSVKLEKIMTEKTDNERKRIICSANAHINTPREVAERVFILGRKYDLLQYPEPGEKMTDTNFEKLITKRYGSKSAFNREVNDELDAIMYELKELVTIIEYIAQRTDDGKLIVNIED